MSNAFDFNSAVGRNLLNASLKELLASGDYSDFEVVCEGKSFKVHKAIICPRSQYFTKAVKFGKEAEENKITLQDDELEIVEYMLQYLYEGDYTLPQPPPSDNPQANPPAQQHPIPNPSTQQNPRSIFGSPGTQPNPTQTPAQPAPTGLFGSPAAQPNPTSSAGGTTIFPSTGPSAAPTSIFTIRTTSPTASAPIFGSARPRWSFTQNGTSQFNVFPHTCPFNNLCSQVLCTHHQCGRDCRDYRGGCRGFTCLQCPLLKFTAPNMRPEDLLCHVKLYALADKYMIEGLKQLIAPRFKTACEGLWHHREFLDAADLVYSTTPDNDRVLRNIIVDTFDEHMELLNEAEDLMTEHNGLAFALLKKTTAKRQSK